MLAVRTDKNVDLNAFAVGEVESYDLGRFAQRDQPVPEMQTFRPQRRSKYTLQIGAMRTEIGRADSVQICPTFRDRK